MTESVELNEKAYRMLVNAKRPGETLSDTIIRNPDIRKANLQKRGEIEITTTDGKKVKAGIVEGLCLGTGFCAVLAPEHFSLERRQIGKEPLGIADAEEKLVDLERLQRAAESCPWRAIYLKDSQSGDYVVRSG
ncbi:MAG TPA: ferredoxin [Nitrososphaerales archaeon]|nr:ferredoxin [Nitrososphaerales archaeon]